jgi:hypothetical protein
MKGFLKLIKLPQMRDVRLFSDQAVQMYCAERKKSDNKAGGVISSIFYL